MQHVLHTAFTYIFPWRCSRLDIVLLRDIVHVSTLSPLSSTRSVLHVWLDMPNVSRDTNGELKARLNVHALLKASKQNKQKLLLPLADEACMTCMSNWHFPEPEVTSAITSGWDTLQHWHCPATSAARPAPFIIFVCCRPDKCLAVAQWSKLPSLGASCNILPMSHDFNPGACYRQTMFICT